MALIQLNRDFLLRPFIWLWECHLSYQRYLCQHPKTGEHKPKRLTALLALATLYSNYLYLAILVTLRFTNWLEDFLWDFSENREFIDSLIDTISNFRSVLNSVDSRLLYFSLLLFPVAFFFGCHRRYLSLSILCLYTQLLLH